MQLHFALNAPPAWMEPELVKVPLVHLTESLEQVCASVTEANNGLLPARPTLAIGQPVAVDPSRAPEGGWILWIQMQEMPARLKGDAAGQIDTPADGRWNEAVREAYADRVQARLERVMPGLAERIVGRRAYSPADLETLNCNLVGGDPYSGICSPDQFWLRLRQRRRRTRPPHAGRRPVSHRRVHPPRSRTGRGLGHAGRPGDRAEIAARRPGLATFRRADPSARRDAARAVRPSRATRATPASCRTNNNTPWLGDKAMRKSMPAWALLLASALGPSAALAIEGGAPADLSRRPGKLHGRRPAPPGVHFLTYGGALRYDSCAATAASRWCATSRSRSTCWRHASSGRPLPVLGGSLALHTVVPLLDVDFRANGARFKSSGLGDIAVGAALGYHASPALHYLFGVDVYAPTGNYDAKDPSSLGKNY